MLDGHTVNPGDLSWDALGQFGEFAVHERTPPELVLERAAGADALLTNKVVLNAQTQAALPALRYIGVTATGYNIVDVAAAAKRGITVTNVPAYSTASVAQLTFALLLELTHHAGLHSDAVRAGEWSASPDFSYAKTPLIELDGLTLGLVGWGATAQAVARIGAAFGMKVIACRRQRSEPPPGVEFVALEEVFRRADVVSLHCPLTPDTAGLINAQRLALMKRSAFVINTGRGGLVVEQDLADALNTGRIAGAAADVLSQEPPPPANPLLTARNCVITPHFAWASLAARRRLLEAVIGNLAAFVRGAPRNVVP